MANKKSTKKSSNTKRAPKTTAKKPTVADLNRLKAAELRAATAYREAAWDVDRSLPLALTLNDQAAKLSRAVREIASPGPDGGGYVRAMCAAADVARYLEHEAICIKRQVLGEVAS